MQAEIDRNSVEASRFIEAIMIKLVREAPQRDPAEIATVRTALDRIGTPLAASIARVLDGVANDRIDPAISLPALAEACATLVAGLAGKLDQRSLDAACHQLDSLEPVPRPPTLVSLRRR